MGLPKQGKERMLRYVWLIIAALVLGSGGALAEESGRYRVITAPLGLEGQPETAILLDTATGRSWHAIVDDKGRPRWRGIEFAGGTQGVADSPDEHAEKIGSDTQQ